MEMQDNVNKPEHYTYGKYECIDVIKEVTSDLTGEEAFCIGNALKYIWRWRHKNGTEDIKKAIWYLNRIIQSSYIYKDKNPILPEELLKEEDAVYRYNKG
jgi:hypothetical protein